MSFCHFEFSGSYFSSFRYFWVFPVSVSVYLWVCEQKNKAVVYSIHIYNFIVKAAGCDVQISIHFMEHQFNVQSHCLSVISSLTSWRMKHCDFVTLSEHWSICLNFWLNQWGEFIWLTNCRQGECSGNLVENSHAVPFGDYFGTELLRYLKQTFTLSQKQWASLMKNRFMCKLL